MRGERAESFDFRFWIADCGLEGQKAELRGQKTESFDCGSEGQKTEVPSSLCELQTPLFELRRDKSPRQAEDRTFRLRISDCGLRIGKKY